MNEVIAKLYEIEETAGNILDNAKRARDNLQSQQKLEEQAFEREQMHDLERRIQRKSQELSDQTEAEIAVMTETYRRQRQRLDERYDRHLEELAEQIIRKITEV